RVPPQDLGSIARSSCLRALRAILNQAINIIDGIVNRKAHGLGCGGGVARRSRAGFGASSAAPRDCASREATGPAGGGVGSRHRPDGGRLALWRPRTLAPTWSRWLAGGGARRNSVTALHRCRREHVAGLYQTNRFSVRRSSASCVTAATRDTSGTRSATSFAS